MMVVEPFGFKADDIHNLLVGVGYGEGAAAAVFLSGAAHGELGIWLEDVEAASCYCRAVWAGIMHQQLRLGIEGANL